MCDNIDERLKRIETNLETILKELEVIKRSGQHMDSHIHFINNVYSAVRYPLNSLMSRFSKKSLPVISFSLEPTPSLETDVRKTE